MRKNIKNIFMLMIINIIFITATFAQGLPKPGSDEWKKLPIELRREACNIPETELANLSTGALLQKCLDYQFMSDILFTYEFRGGLDAIAKSFNGLSELFKRNDAAKTILNYYIKLNPRQIVSIESSVEKGKFSFDFVFLELYFTQPAMLTQLQGREETVIKEIMKKLNECIEVNKRSDNTVYSGLTLNVKGLLIAVLLDSMKDKSVGNMTASYPEYKSVITNLSISDISEGLFTALMLRASEL